MGNDGAFLSDFIAETLTELGKNNSYATEDVGFPLHYTANCNVCEMLRTTMKGTGTIRQGLSCKKAMC